MHLPSHHLAISRPHGALVWTQERLALECGLERTYLVEIEGGKRNPALRVVERLAGALNIEPAELMKKP